MTATQGTPTTEQSAPVVTGPRPSRRLVTDLLPGDRVVYELRGRTVAEVVLWSAPLVIPVDYVAVRFAGRANDVHYRSQTYLAVAR